MNKRIFLFFALFLSLIIGTQSAFAITVADSNTIKALFSATEVESFEGIASSPAKAVFWAEATCPNQGVYAYPMPSGYSLVSCSTDSVLGTHGGCSVCLMSRIEVKSSSIASPINGLCGSANGQSFTSAPTSTLCASGTASAISGTGPWTLT
ncbi:MAG: hypothetical protein PHG23_03750, partial [Candidatus Pacebacteria bacterium]|nr:hypothetical protein [Candidatus Paceibacterota bacterium]